MVRIGFIGAGGIARHHMETLAKIDKAEIAAIADVRKEAACEASSKYGGAVYTDYSRMLEKENLHAVYICVPPDAHGAMEIEAAGKGLHLFVEKPVNIDVRQALEIADVIEKAGVIAVPGYTLRYMSFFEQLKALLQNAPPVRQALVTRWGGLPKTPWWRKMRSSGGQLVEMVTHQIDLLRAVIGDIAKVYAAYTYAHNEPEADVPSHYNAVLEFAGGAAALFSTNCASAAGRNDMVLVTDKANIEVNYGKGVAVKPEGFLELPESPSVPGIDQCFVEAVASRNRSLLKSDYRDGVRSLAVTLACNLSAQQGRPVAVDELMDA